ncbi:DNA polymerase III subunit beta [Cytobacillus sp. FSL R7-0680]|uniref:DNA polymerase III subunit beta n=1 Tax=Cytobacillus sp. FSL R7-0680 TaxID=2921689 RepID=UPI0030F9DA81
MELTICKSTLQGILKNISKVLKNSQSPMKIIVNSHQVTFIAGNEDVLMEINIPSETDEGLIIKRTGSVIISAKYFSDIIKKLPANIHIYLSEHSTINIQSEEIHTRIFALTDVKTLNIPDVPAEGVLSLNAAELHTLIRQTVFAAAVHDNRPVLTGVKIVARHGELTFISTDAHRYSISSLTIPSQLETEMIVPSESLLEWSKLSLHTEEEVALSLSKNHLALKSKHCYFYIRLIEGRYPATSDFIPKQKVSSFHIHTETFLHGIERAALFSDAKKNHHIKLQIQNGRLRISSNAKQIGRIEEWQPIEELSGKGDVEVFLDNHFLLDYLRVIDDEYICCTYSGTMKPVLFEPVKGSHFQHLISQVRSF